MTRTFRQPGDVLEHTNASGADIAAGDVVVMGATVGVALTDIPDGESGSVSITGVHELAKDGSAWSQGDSLHFDVTNGQWSTAAVGAGEDQIDDAGIAALDAAAGDAQAEVKLTPGTGTAVSG